MNTNRVTRYDNERAPATSEREDDDATKGKAESAYDAMCERMKDRWKGNAAPQSQADQPSDAENGARAGGRELAPHERRMTDRWKK